MAPHSAISNIIFHSDLLRFFFFLAYPVEKEIKKSEKKQYEKMRFAVLEICGMLEIGVPSPPHIL